MTDLLVIDVGTTGLRAALVNERLEIVDLEYRPCPPSTPAPGLVEFDPAIMAHTAIEAATSVLERSTSPVEAVGVTTQRASTVVWDRSTGEPVAPGLGWQDLRTVGECLMANAENGWTLAPNQSATKYSWLLANTPDLAGRDLCAGTVDSWIVWSLTRGALHVSDHGSSSATMSGLRRVEADGWNDDVLNALAIPASILPTVVDSSGVVGEATALPGAPPIAAILGDQSASTIGQGCVQAGRVKITFGSGGMLDVCVDGEAPTTGRRNANGTYPLVLWTVGGTPQWGVEGIMLSAGTNVEWLRDDLGLLDTPAQSHDVAAECADTDGVMYVPALLGLGTPHWDYGARGTLLGITRGTERRHVVRAVLDGVAHRGADLLDAAVADTGVVTDEVRIDGGMSQNPTFVQALADATGRAVEVSPVVEATTRGAAFMAGLAIGAFERLDDADALWQPAARVEPSSDTDTAAARERWSAAVERSREWHPDLSALDM
ncbi:MAG: FGGY family carbohydrate kinase [Actinomycetota bacterium]